MLGSGQVLSKFRVVPSPCPPGHYQLCGLWVLGCRMWRKWRGLGVAPRSYFGASLTRITFALEAKRTVKAWWQQVNPGLRECRKHALSGQAVCSQALTVGDTTAWGGHC